MEEESNQNEFPQEILERQVIGICPECKGEGMLWGFDEKTHWAVSCKRNCNCLGYILDLPEDWKRHPNDCDIPF